MSLLHRVFVALVVLAPLTITQVLAAVAQDDAVHDGADGTASLVAPDAPPADLTPPTAPDDHPQGGLLQMLGIDTRCDTHNCARVRLDTDVNNANVLDTVPTESGQSMIRWGPHPIWNAGNQGAGTGMDADTLDGINSDVFVLTDRANRFTEDQTVEANLLVTPAPWGGGKLGIGTTDPQRALDVVGDAAFSGEIQVESINVHPTGCVCDVHVKNDGGKLRVSAEDFGGSEDNDVFWVEPRGGKISREVLDAILKEWFDGTTHTTTIQDPQGVEHPVAEYDPSKYTYKVPAEFRRGVTVNGDGTGRTIYVVDPQKPSTTWELTGPAAQTWEASVNPDKGGFMFSRNGEPVVVIGDGKMELSNDDGSAVQVLKGNGASGIVFKDTTSTVEPQFSVFAGNDAIRIRATGETTSTGEVAFTGDGLIVANANIALQGGSIHFGDGAVIFRSGGSLQIDGPDKADGTRGPIVQLRDDGAVVVHGDFVVTGKKSAAVETSNGSVLTYAVESPEVRLTDEGTGELLGGVATIDLDPLFAETIEGELLVHVTPYGPATLYVDERGPAHFVVRSLDGSDVPFAWTASAFRLGYSDVRLEPFTP